MAGGTGGTIKARQVELLDGARVRFTLPCGCRQTKDYGKGPVPRRVPRFSLEKFLVPYWQDSGVYVPSCKKHPEIQLHNQKKES